jgi:isoquinoline 1-oxidoreductase subunit beta
MVESMAAGGELDRRSFLVCAGAQGLTLGISIPAGTERAHAANGPREITCWLLIAPDDAVTIRIARAEMGQGTLTGLALLVAEELECDWAKVRTEFVRPAENLRRHRIWGDMSTSASRSIATSQLYLRQAGAAAREMLIAAAAARWKVPAAECTARTSTITHAASGRTVTFGAVAADAADLTLPANVGLKDPDTWKLAGRPRRRLDVHDKVTAQPIYAIDVRLPGMLYATILQ